MTGHHDPHTQYLEALSDGHNQAPVAVEQSPRITGPWVTWAGIGMLWLCASLLATPDVGGCRPTVTAECVAAVDRFSTVTTVGWVVWLVVAGGLAWWHRDPQETPARDAAAAPGDRAPLVDRRYPALTDGASAAKRTVSRRG